MSRTNRPSPDLEFLPDTCPFCLEDIAITRPDRHFEGCSAFFEAFDMEPPGDVPTLGG